MHQLFCYAKLLVNNFQQGKHVMLQILQGNSKPSNLALRLEGGWVGQIIMNKGLV